MFYLLLFRIHTKAKKRKLSSGAQNFHKNKIDAAEIISFWAANKDQMKSLGDPVFVADSIGS